MDNNNYVRTWFICVLFVVVFHLTIPREEASLQLSQKNALTVSQEPEDLTEAIRTAIKAITLEVLKRYVLKNNTVLAKFGAKLEKIAEEILDDEIQKIEKNLNTTDINLTTNTTKPQSLTSEIKGKPNLISSNQSMKTEVSEKVKLQTTTYKSTTEIPNGSDKPAELLDDEYLRRKTNAVENEKKSTSDKNKDIDTSEITDTTELYEATYHRKVSQTSPRNQKQTTEG